MQSQSQFEQAFAVAIGKVIEHERLSVGRMERLDPQSIASCNVAQIGKPARHRLTLQPFGKALSVEVEQALDILDTPAARMIARGEERPLLLEEVEVLLASDALVIDACRETGAASSIGGTSQ
jgi:hypothetical protein